MDNDFDKQASKILREAYTTIYDRRQQLDEVLPALAAAALPAAGGAAAGGAAAAAPTIVGFSPLAYGTAGAAAGLAAGDEEEMKVTVFELENGNGYQYAINGHAAQPNIDIGETHENQLGYDTKEEALHAGRDRAAWMSDMESQSRATGEWPTDPYG